MSDMLQLIVTRDSEISGRVRGCTKSLWACDAGV